jgi:DNA-binding transcriptional regulator YdaS (Cro superfamily)
MTPLNYSALFEALGGRRRVARELGVAPSTVARWARGETAPAGGHALRLVELTAGALLTQGGAAC